MPRWATRAARLGHLSVGGVYVLVGAFALAAAVDPRREPTDSVGAFRHLMAGSPGNVVAAALVVGLIADAVWQAFRAFGGAARGRGALIQRVTWIGSGAIHLGMAIAVLRLATGTGHPDGDAAVRTWSGRILSAPHGDALLDVVGLVMVVIAAVMTFRAWSGDIDRAIDPAMSRGARRFVWALARVGLAARAVTCAAVGVFLLLAAMHHDPAEARSVAGTFRTVKYVEYGQAVLGVLAVGFVANGVVELVKARYRSRRVDA